MVMGSSEISLIKTCIDSYNLHQDSGDGKKYQEKGIKNWLILAIRHHIPRDVQNFWQEYKIHLLWKRETSEKEEVYLDNVCLYLILII